MVPVFIKFFQKFPNFCGQICGLGLISVRFRTQACATFFTDWPHSNFGKLPRVASNFIGWNFIHLL